MKNVSLNDPEVYKELLLAYVKDVREPPTPEVQKRWREIVEKAFLADPKEIILKGQRCGVNVAVSLSTLYARTPLTKLDLYENLVRDHGCEVLAGLLKEVPNLTYLNLGSNDIGSAAGVTLGNAVANHKKIQVLILGSDTTETHFNRLDPTAGRAIVDALKKARALRHLDLNRCPIARGSQEPIYALARSLATPSLCQLQILKLGSVGMNTDAAVELIRSLNVTTTIQHLDLHDNDLSTPAGVELGRLVAARHTTQTPLVLKTVLFHMNRRIGDKGIVDLFRCLGNDDGLETLDLRDCGIGDESFSVLCHALPTNATMTHLNVSNNAITSQGGIEVSRALVHHSSMLFLGLSGNKIRDEGACSLAGMLEANDVLQTLELDDTRISDRGAIAFGVALATNSTLTTLRLSDNQISDDGGKALVPLLEKNQHLLNCNVQSNSIDHNTVSRLKTVMQRNQKLKADELPHRLQKEVVRLHYQKYKLEEARNALEGQRKLKQDIESTQEKYEIAFRDEEQEARKKSKELQEKIKDEEALTLDLQQRILAKDQEIATFTAQWEENMKNLQETLADEVSQREKAEDEFKKMQEALVAAEKSRVTNEQAVKQKLADLKEDKERWQHQAKDLRVLLDKVKAQLKEAEAAVAAAPPPPPPAAEVPMKKTKGKK